MHNDPSLLLKNVGGLSARQFVGDATKSESIFVYWSLKVIVKTPKKHVQRFDLPLSRESIKIKENKKTLLRQRLYSKKNIRKLDVPSSALFTEWKIIYMTFHLIKNVVKIRKQGSGAF